MPVISAISRSHPCFIVAMSALAIGRNKKAVRVSNQFTGHTYAILSRRLHTMGSSLALTRLVCPPRSSWRMGYYVAIQDLTPCAVLAMTSEVLLARQSATSSETPESLPSSQRYTIVLYFPRFSSYRDTSIATD